MYYRMEDISMLKLRRCFAVCAGVFLIAALTGCSVNSGPSFKINDTIFYFVTGREEDAVMKSGDYRITKGQARLIISLMQDNYAELLTENIWSYQIDGEDFSSYVYESAESMAARLLLVVMMADEMGIKLENEELEQVSVKVRAFYEGYGKEGLEYITEEEVNELFSMFELSDKVYVELTRNVDTEISVDEARIISIQYIYSKDSMKKIDNALIDLEAGYEFITVAMKYSDSKEYMAEIGRGELSREFEEAAFNLDAGQISEMVICDNGYYLIKCIDDNIAEKSELQRSVIIENRKQEQFDKFLADFANGTYIEFDEQMWGEVCNSTKD